MNIRHINHEMRRWGVLREQLTNRRRAIGASQDQVAEHASLSSRTTVGRIERGEVVPSIDTLLAHAAALDLEVALVPPHVARLLEMDNRDLIAIVQAATAAAAHPLTLPVELRARTLLALGKLSAHNGR